MNTDTKVIGYIRVSTDKQGERGAGMEAQKAAIIAECAHRDWQLLRIETDTLSGKSMNGRTGLTRALDACRSGVAAGIVVHKLDRLSRSVVDAGGLLEEARERGFNIVALDFGLDFSTPQGELVANVLTAIAQWERRIIGQRTRDALAQVKRRPQQLRELDKKPVGRPPQLDPRVRRRIRGLRTRGHSYNSIADLLNAEGVPTAQSGKRWHAMTVRHIAADYDKAAPKQRRKRPTT